jgi:hypothetical protein
MHPDLLRRILWPMNGKAPTYPDYLRATSGMSHHLSPFSHGCWYLGHDFLRQVFRGGGCE